MYIEKISNEELRLLPLTSFEQKIITIDNPGKLELAIKEINDNRILGFDTETKPAFKKNQYNELALVQLSSLTTVYLIRLQKTGFSTELAKIFENNEILKVGVAIHDDIKKLQKVRDFSPQGFVELQSFVQEFGIKDQSLRKIAGIILGIRISKSQRLSNWENPELSEGQLRYAATDAWVCRKIYKALKE